MDYHSETKEAKPNTNKVSFSITPEGEIKFDAQGLNEWEVTDAIAQVGTQAREQRKATYKIKQMTFASELSMHGLAIAFTLVAFSSVIFVLSQALSNNSQPQIQIHNIQGTN